MSEKVIQIEKTGEAADFARTDHPGGRSGQYRACSSNRACSKLITPPFDWVRCGVARTPRSSSRSPSRWM